MSVELRVAKEYKCHLSDEIVSGDNDVREFIGWLRGLEAEQEEGFIYISDDEKSAEIPINVLWGNEQDPRWGETIKKILAEMDKSNGFARIEIT